VAHDTFDGHPFQGLDTARAAFRRIRRAGRASSRYRDQDVGVVLTLL
jgi:hypothetical protein